MSKLWFTALAAVSLTLAGCGVPSTSLLANSRSTLKASQAARGGFFDLQGRSVSLDALRGKPVVLSFLSPTDNDSQADVPLLIRLAGAYQPEGVVFIIAGENASAQDLAAFARQNQLPMPVWQDPDGSELGSRGFSNLPDFQFINRQGQVVASEQGFLSRGQLLADIALIQ